MTAYFCIALTLAFAAISQLLQKSVALRHSKQNVHSALAFYCREPRFWLAMLCLGIGMASWLVVLTIMEVSKAYALLSMNYLLVPLLATKIFSERLPARGWLGAIALCIGVLLIGKS